MKINNLGIYKGMDMNTMLTKLNEEVLEVHEAVDDMTIENLKEELMDVIQCCFGIAAVACINLEDCVESHNNKLLNRGHTLHPNLSPFEIITDEMHELYKIKNKNYGNSFSEQFSEYGMTSVCIRLDDKIRRLKTLNRDSSNSHDESMRDTLIDTANYAVMAVMELDK
ncbi:MAG: nucleotide modification associated domain-containing protein [Paraclostridium sp.]